MGAGFNGLESFRTRTPFTDCVAAARLHSNFASFQCRRPIQDTHKDRDFAASAPAGTPDPASSAHDIGKEAVDARVDGARAKPYPVDARSVQTILERSFRPGAEEDAAVAEDARSGKGRFAYATTIRRFAKIALGVALVVAFGLAPLRAMLATTSVEAIVNARIETIRSPIEGIVQAPAEKTVSWSSTAPPKLVVVDPYADRSRLDELRRELNTLEFAEADA